MPRSKCTIAYYMNVIARAAAKKKVNKVVDTEAPRVVAIGASAGGLYAFREFIENLPTDTGMAFVLLSHILRGSKSLLPEILSRSTKMPVIQVRDREQILGNRIYILPPDKFMEIQGDALLLVARPDRPVNSAIDHFLFSLAEDQAHGSIGIILRRSFCTVVTPGAPQAAQRASSFSLKECVLSIIPELIGLALSPSAGPKF
jgi:chemotaxis response regulator CheB